MDSPFDRLLELVLGSEPEELSGTLTVATGTRKLTLEVSRGRLIDSSLHGPGITFTDFLLAEGCVDQKGFDGALGLVKEEDIPLSRAIVRSGAATEEALDRARRNLSARRLAEALAEGMESLDFVAGLATGGESIGDAPSASPVVLDALKKLYEAASQPLDVPPSAVLRPTERLSRHLGDLRLIMGKLPLPRVGGETAAALVERHGEQSSTAISVLVRAGMLMTEFAPGGAPVDALDATIRWLAPILRNEALSIIAGLTGRKAAAASLLLETGDMWADGLGAMDEARRSWESARDMSGDDGTGAGKLLPILVMSGTSNDPVLLWPLSRIVEAVGSGPTGASLLCALARHRLAEGQNEEALHALRAALVAHPSCPEVPPIFFRLMSRSPGVVRGTSGIEPAALVLDVARCARENGMPDLAAHVMTEAGRILEGNADILEQTLDLYRTMGWSPDLVEAVVDFACSSSRKGWTNPLWSLGAWLARADVEVPARLAIDTYEILVKASPNRREALGKLASMVEKLGQPNLLIDLLERSLPFLTEDDALEEIYSRLASLYLEQFADLRASSRWASMGLARRPESPASVDIVLKASRAGKLSRSSGMRFAHAMMRLSAIPTAEKLDWLVQAARIAEKDLKDLPLALELLRRIRSEYGVEQAGREIEMELGRIESVVSGLEAERTSLRDGLDLGELAASKIRVVEEAEALRRLARISLQFEDGKAEACGILVILLGAGEADWDAAELALVKVEDREPRLALLGAAASLAEAGAERRPPLPLLEEIVEAWEPSGGADDALLDSVHRAILAISPFNRDSVHHLGTRAAQAGDVDRMVQFTERRIATARPQERGSLYVELASLGDLVPEYADRVPTFWRIASNAMPTHPSVLANDFVELVTARRWDEAAAWIRGNISQFPRTHQPALGALMRDLLDRAGDRQAALAAAVEEIERHPWDGALAGEALSRSDAVGNFTALADRVKGILAWHDHDAGIVRSVTQLVRSMPRGPEVGGALAAAARLLISRATPPSPELVGLLEVLAWCLADAGDPLLGTKCLERALVASTDPEKRIGLVKRIAELLAAAGDQGREALVALVPRAARMGADEDFLGPIRAAIVDRLGISQAGAATARAIAVRSLPKSDRHADLAAAMLLHSMGAGREEVRAAIAAAAEPAANGPEAMLLEGAIYGTGAGGGGLAEGLEAAAAAERDPAQAASLLLKAADIRATTPGMEARGVDDAIAALELAPGNQAAMERAEALAVALADPARLRAYYEAALPHLPGRKTVQAFHYRFGKIQEETLKDPISAAEMYLQALGVEPRPGAILEAVERVAHRMQRHEPLVRAAGLLCGVERERPHVAPFVARNAERFLEEENLASAHALVADSIALDPRMDVTRVVRLMAERSQAGRASAQKIAQRWVGLLEASIGKRGEDSDLPRRLDAVAALRHEISSEGEGGGAAAAPSGRRLSIPPGADAAWSKIVEEPSDDREISLVQQVSSPPIPAAKPKARKPSSEAVPEDSKVTVMPKPMTDRRSQSDEVEKEALRSEPPPPIDMLALSHAATSVPSAPPPPATEPPAAPPAPVIPEPPAPPAAPAAPEPPAPSPAIRPAAPKPRMGLRGMERRFHTTSPMPVVKPAREERRAASPPREVASDTRPAPASILEEIGRREEVEPEVIMRAETVPPTPEMIAEVRASAREQLASAEPEDSVQVMIGEGDFPELKVEKLPSKVSPLSETVPMYVPGMEPSGDDPLAALRRDPWDMVKARTVLEGSDSLMPGPGMKALLGSLVSVSSDDPASFRHARPTFRDARATVETFRTLLADQAREPVLEALGIVTDAAHHLFKERIGDYGMRIPDQITPFSTGPVAPILEKAIRSLGYQRMAVYYRRDQKYEVHVVRTTPPSITVMVPLGKLPTSLEFYMGRGFWAVNPRRLLAFSLPAEEGTRLGAALVQAFGRSRQGARMESGVSAVVQELWKMPAKAQDKIRILLAGNTSIDFVDLSHDVKAECSRAGILFSGDLGAAVLHDLPAVRPDARGRIDGALLVEAIRGSQTAQDTIRFALRADVLAFMDRALGAPPPG